MSSPTMYYTARKFTDGSYLGMIYYYAFGTGDEEREWTSARGRDTKEEALDDAIRYAEENDLDVELDDE